MSCNYDVTEVSELLFQIRLSIDGLEFAHIGEYLIKAPPTCIPGFVTDLVKPYYTLGEKKSDDLLMWKAAKFIFLPTISANLQQPLLMSLNVDCLK